MEICEYVVKTYFETVFKEEKGTVDKKDKDTAIHFTKCTLFGLYIDWLNHGMKDTEIERIKRMIVLCRGLSDEMLRRCRNNSRNKCCDEAPDKKKPAADGA